MSKKIKVTPWIRGYLFHYLSKGMSVQEACERVRQRHYRQFPIDQVVSALSPTRGSYKVSHLVGQPRSVFVERYAILVKRHHDHQAFLRQYWDDPANHAAQSRLMSSIASSIGAKGNKARWADSNAREEAAELLRERHRSDREFVLKLRLGSNQYWADPESRKRQSEVAREVWRRIRADHLRYAEQSRIRSENTRRSWQIRNLQRAVDQYGKQVGFEEGRLVPVETLDMPTKILQKEVIDEVHQAILQLTPSQQYVVCVTFEIEISIDHSEGVALPDPDSEDWWIVLATALEDLKSSEGLVGLVNRAAP